MSERSESSYDMFISQARANRAWVEGYLPMSLTKSAPSCAKDLLQPPFCPRLGACGERSVGYTSRSTSIRTPRSSCCAITCRAGVGHCASGGFRTRMRVVRLGGFCRLSPVLQEGFATTATRCPRGCTNRCI
jgi:hypothetical protein